MSASRPSFETDGSAAGLLALESDSGHIAIHRERIASRCLGDQGDGGWVGASRYAIVVSINDEKGVEELNLRSRLSWAGVYH